MRYRILWVEEGETSSSYFLGLEKKRSADHSSSDLRAADSSLVTDQDGLSAVFSAFYADLFSASPVDPVAQDELLSQL